MKPQLSQDYSVDSRYTAGKRAADNTAGKAFVDKYINRKREENHPNMAAERQTEDRYIVSGPGSSQYRFRNAFRTTQ